MTWLEGAMTLREVKVVYCAMDAFSMRRILLWRFFLIQAPNVSHSHLPSV